MEVELARRGLALEFVVPGSDEPDLARAGQVVRTCHENGVIVLTCGTYGNVIRLLPPLTIPYALLDEGLAILEDSVHATS